MNLLDFLTNNTAAAQKKAEYKHTRFSQQAGEDVVFTIRSLDFDTISELIRLHEDDFKIYIVLESLEDFKNKALLTKYKVSGFDQLVNKIFLPGEINEIYNRISELSGYGGGSVQEIKKK